MARRRKQLNTEAQLYEYAVGALGRRMRSVAELKRLLRARSAEGSEQAIDDVISRLKQQRYLNDSDYAASYAAFRKDNEKFGAKRVISDLRARGVHADVIEKEVSTCYAACDEQQLARDFLRRKRIHRPENDREAARIFRALLRAGFSTQTGIAILKKWDVDEETVSALEGEADV
ncbi:MAG TPA: RecX family transcriptional regulator [Terriglobales bacterium]|nr:RecX family transcriptional regulator [Terriglobales bacterium]